MKNKFKLGDEARDKITGFTGTVIARIEYINGCIQYEIQPSVGNDGNQRKHDWIDKTQLELVKENGKKKVKEIHGGVNRSHPD